MPRFFFNLRVRPDADWVSTDVEGDEIADVGLVRAHALRIAKAMTRTRTHAVRDWMACAFEIEDEQRDFVMKVPFSETVDESSAFGEVGARDIV